MQGLVNRALNTGLVSRECRKGSFVCKEGTPKAGDAVSSFEFRLSGRLQSSVIPVGMLHLNLTCRYHRSVTSLEGVLPSLALACQEGLEGGRLNLILEETRREETCLDLVEALEPPEAGDDPIYKLLLQFVRGLQLAADSISQLLQRACSPDVVTREEKAASE